MWDEQRASPELSFVSVLDLVSVLVGYPTFAGVGLVSFPDMSADGGDF
jgi:hypothetical protein